MVTKRLFHLDFLETGKIIFQTCTAHMKTLLSEEALLLAKFLRNEKKEWTPRTVVLN